MKLLGKVKWFNNHKGFGFLTSNNKDYFIHIRELKKCMGYNAELRDGQIIRFLPVETRQGLQATALEVVEADGNTL